MSHSYILFPLAIAAALTVSAAGISQPGLSSGPGARYATDAYPGFDNADGVIRPSKKTPRWFQWLNGPKMTDAESQFAWAGELERDGSASSARSAYDALVRNWPTAAEAPKAQLKVAELAFAEGDTYEAFEEYRYLLDFYSSVCDYNAVVAKMYDVAERMREEGKTIVFFRFDNTVDVRRAYESLVLRAPGAAFVPAAMLTIASLREDEGKLQVAVTVYENLRNLYPASAEAREAMRREGRVRMELLRELGYNRSRVQDTVDFLKLGLRGDLSAEAREEFEAALAEAEGLIADEAWKSAKFYDSATRTRRSAINAYERYLEVFPDGAHADEARARLDVLKGAVK